MRVKGEKPISWAEVKGRARGLGLTLASRWMVYLTGFSVAFSCGGRAQTTPADAGPEKADAATTLSGRTGYAETSMNKGLDETSTEGVTDSASSIIHDSHTEDTNDCVRTDDGLEEATAEPDGTSARESTPGGTGLDAGTQTTEADPLIDVDAVSSWGNAGVPERLEGLYELERASYNTQGCTIILGANGDSTMDLLLSCSDIGEEEHRCWCKVWLLGLDDDVLFEDEPFVGDGFVPCVHAMEECSIRYFD